VATAALAVAVVAAPAAAADDPSSPLERRLTRLARCRDSPRQAVAVWPRAQGMYTRAWPDCTHRCAGYRLPLPAELNPMRNALERVQPDERKASSRDNLLDRSAEVPFSQPEVASPSVSVVARADHAPVHDRVPQT
jgi:hypothetical protein